MTNSRKRLLVAAIAAALAAAYALAGFVLVPWIATRELPRFVAQRLHHSARVGDISFNPFTLRLHARDFALETKEGRPVIGFADAEFALEWQSLLRRAWVFSEVRLVDPAVHLEIAKQGRLNLAELVTDDGGAGSTQPVRFSIGVFSVANGSIDFEDHRHAYRNRAERLSLELSSLSTLDAEKGSYAFTGQTPGGAKLRWKGDLSLAPLAAAGTITVGNAALKELMPYVDEFTTVRVLGGRADLELPYHLSLAGGEPSFSLKGAKIGVRELALAGTGENALLANFGAIALGGIEFDWGRQQIQLKTLRVGESTVRRATDKTLLATAGPLTLDGLQFALASGAGAARSLAVAGVTLAAGNEGKPLVQLREIGFDGIALDLHAQRVSAKALHVGGFALAARRDANGEFDLLRLFAGRGGDAAEKSDAKPGEWRASIDTVQLGDGALQYRDATAEIPLALALEGLNCAFSIEATTGGEGIRASLDAGKCALAKLEASAASASAESALQPAIRLAQLSIDGTRYDSDASALDAGTVRIGSFGVDTVLVNSRLSLLGLLPPAGKSKSGKPLSIRAKSIDLGDGAINFTDRGQGIALALERIALKLGDASNDGVKPLAFDLIADVKSGGRIALRGRAVPAQGTLEAKLEADRVALAPVQSVLERWANAKFTSGDVSLSGTLRAGGKDAALGYSGSASIANLALEDASGLRLFGWKSLATDGLKMTLTPDRIDIEELRLTAPTGRLAIAKDGTSNISRAFAKDQPATEDSKPPAAEAGAARTASQAAAPELKADGAKAEAAGTFAVAVRRARVDQGALDFSDGSLSPGFAAKIYELAGTANGLSSNHEVRSQFSLEGRVDEFGYARLSGAVNPFAPRNRSTFRVQLRNIDLIAATPYAMRFAGYRIAAGRLGLDLSYRVRDSLIEGDNKITLDRFTLGEQVDSPDAVKLPIELAVKLLKDSDGAISLQVPVKGDLDDPQFSLAPLIWKAVGNFIGSVVSAPFRALAQLLGGGAGEDPGAIAFDPGSSRLLPPEQEKLARVVVALAKHTGLKLLIPGRYDIEVDARAMKRAALNRDIGRRAGFAATEDGAPGPVNIEDRPTRRALRAAFAERFSKTELDRLRTEAEAKARAAGNTAPTVTARVLNFADGEPQLVDTREFHQALLRRLREAQTLPAEALAELARQRVLAIETALKAAGADASRISHIIIAPSSDADAKQVIFHLSLAVK